MAYFATRCSECLTAKCLVILFCGIILNCRAATTRVTSFSSTPAVRGGIQNPVVSTISSRSDADCSRECLQHMSCITFSYDGATQICKLSDGEISNGGVPAYTLLKDCPAANGYRLFRRADILFCLRFNETEVHQPVAVADCNGDGSHLLLFENQEMHEFMKYILNDRGSDSIWVDGKDIHNNDTMFSSTGAPLQYVRWSSGEPDGGPEDCIRLSNSRGFDFKDLYCAGTRYVGYVCQRDVK